MDWVTGGCHDHLCVCEFIEYIATIVKYNMLLQTRKAPACKVFESSLTENSQVGSYNDLSLCAFTMASHIKPDILNAAIELFADLGYYGVTTRDVAKRSDRTEGSIYRLFKSKEGLFADALAVVKGGALDPAKFVLMLFEQEHEGKHDAAAVIKVVIRRWYDSMPQKTARFLTQAYFVQPKLRHVTGSAYAPIDRIIEIVETTIKRLPKVHSTVNARFAAMALILTLLNFKITYSAAYNPKQESAAVESFLQTWFQGLFPGS
jgi:AcrR family transcriptional regulator